MACDYRGSMERGKSRRPRWSIVYVPSFIQSIMTLERLFVQDALISWGKCFVSKNIKSSQLNKILEKTLWRTVYTPSLQRGSSEPAPVFRFSGWQRVRERKWKHTNNQHKYYKQAAVNLPVTPCDNCNMICHGRMTFTACKYHIRKLCWYPNHCIYKLNLCC